MRAASAVGFAATAIAVGCLIWAVARNRTPVAAATAQAADEAVVPRAADQESAGSGAPLPAAERTAVATAAADPAAAPAPALPGARHSGRLLAGHVVTEQGDRLLRGTLFVLERASLPGEDDEALPSIHVEIGADGAFAARLPECWRGPTVHASVVVGSRVLGAATCTVTTDATIVVPDPGMPPGFWVTVRWTDWRPRRAGMLLQSLRRDAGFGDGAWETTADRVYLELVDRPDKISGELLLLVGERHDAGRIQVLARHEFPSLDALQQAAEHGIAVDCRLASIAVPAWAGRNVRSVGIWSQLEAGPAMPPLVVQGGAIRCPLPAGLPCRALGRLDDGSTVHGIVAGEAPTHCIEWIGCAEPALASRIRVLDARGEPIAGAYGTFVSRHDDRRLDRVHRQHGRSGADGWMVVPQLLRGAYDVTVETEVLGDLRNARFRIDVPGHERQCVLPDACAVRLVPSGQHPSAPLEPLRGWFRARGDDGWQEGTQPQWRFSRNGVTPLPGPGSYEFVLSLPPWNGRLDATPDRRNEVVDLVVPMAREVVVEGRLLDQRGVPVAGCVVAHAATAAETRSLPDWARATTDDQGRFQLVLMPGSAMDLLVLDGQWRQVGCIAARSGDVVLEDR
jgi:hypothetical protein